jgi:hypothetical protein
MKHLFAAAIATAVLIWTVPATAAQGTWTGTISDSLCGLSHAAMTEHGTKGTDKQCTTLCVTKGAKYVFVTDGKVLMIANQDLKDLKTFAGDRVTATGDLNRDTVRITKLARQK